MKPSWPLLVAMFCVLPAFGCKKLETGHGSSGGRGGSGGAGGMGGAGGSGGEGGAGGASCPTGLAGPPLVLVPAPVPFCIDSTEVTAAQYHEWLSTEPPVPGDARCGWKASYVPRSAGSNCTANHYEPTIEPEDPVVCVDWCDAFAYCTAAGKRLCGAIGGGPTPYATYSDAMKDEWTFACSAGGARTYPYSNSFNANLCRGDLYDGVEGDGDVDEASNVKSISACQGGYIGIYDMSGNVWEWHDACNEDSTEPDASKHRCKVRGGSFWDGEVSLSCTASNVAAWTRASFYKNVGFRCCTDAL